ncbi:ThiF family adenylyltransferase [Priestia megaterium]|uniref:ThiF family adenylyltransferase n=1 Tax=Priestia megaterium TaxID=1404 RepID=UPI001A950A76|nr:ThiF family adenylyltransferase [Priestia megaterium]QSX23903.1 ThiF family adenylyltransferase [Priestia megaterium]
MITNVVPSESLLRGRRATEFIEGITLLNDLEWSEPIKQWVLHCSLFSDEIEAANLPKRTEWYILIDDEYPKGNIGFFPAKINSFTQTFPHQLYNGEGSKEFPWRSGMLCLDTNVRTLGRFVTNNEPFEEDQRLNWYVERAIYWLIAASLNTLTLDDEPFELVDFPESSALKLGFSENHQSFRYWNSTDIKYGIAEFSVILPGTCLIRRFKKPNGQCFREVNWGQYASQFKCDNRVLGSWVLLKEVPFLEPWKAPSTWEELEIVCAKQGIDLQKKINLLKNKHNYQNKLAHILIVGFPIRNKLSDQDSEIFWKGIEIPILFDLKAVLKRTKLKEKEVMSNKPTHYINKYRKINWMHSFNWSKESVMSRGMLPKSLCNSKVLQIGAGSLGSSLGELLIRGGVEKLGIMDFDLLEMGNITRHTLLINDIDKYKAQSLVDRFNQSSLHSKATAFNGNIKYNLNHNSKELEKYNVILDCTGEDDVLNHLESYTWSQPKRFLSVSLGFGGKRLFFFSSTGVSFPNQTFKKMIRPWLIKEQNHYQEYTFPREGLGCWHPLFPARVDDVWMMAAAAVKKLERVYQEPNVSVLSVYEQQIIDGTFEGLKLVEEVKFNE